MGMEARKYLYICIGALKKKKENKKVRNVGHGSMKLPDSAKSLSLQKYFSRYGSHHTPQHLIKFLMKFHIMLASGIRTFFTQNCKPSVSIHPSFLQTEKADSTL